MLPQELPLIPLQRDHSCPEGQEGQVVHHIVLHFHQSWLGAETFAPAHCSGQSCDIPSPTHQLYKTTCRPVTQVQGKPRGLSEEVPRISKGHPDCALLGMSKPPPSCQWDTSSPWLHFLSASPQVQGREANSQAISIFNADQGCVRAARWDVHTGSAKQAGRTGEAHQPPVNCQR